MAEISIGDFILINFILIIISAFAGASVNSWFRDREAKKAQEQERDSLLRLIDVEVYENMTVLKDMRTDPAISDKYPSRAALSTDAWDQSRARLARLLAGDRDHIFDLVRHYASVRRIGRILADPDAPISAKSKQERRSRTADIRTQRLSLLAKLANLAYLDGEAIRERGKRYLGDLPDYFLTAERDASADLDSVGS